MQKHSPGLGLLVTRKVGPRAWELVEDFRNPYQTVPKGFVFNGADVPRVFWTILDPATEGFEAACVHDYLYVTTLKTKEYADKAFRELLMLYGVDEVRAELAYQAVCVGGQGNYA